MLSLAEALDDVEIAIRQFEFTIKLLSYCELGHIKPEELDTDHVIALKRRKLGFPPAISARKTTLKGRRTCWCSKHLA